MTLPVSPPLTLAQVGVELGIPVAEPVTLNDARVKILAGYGAARETLSMSELLGKTWPLVANCNVVYRPALGWYIYSRDTFDGTLVPDKAPYLGNVSIKQINCGGLSNKYTSIIFDADPGFRNALRMQRFDWQTGQLLKEVILNYQSGGVWVSAEASDQSMMITTQTGPFDFKLWKI